MLTLIPIPRGQLATGNLLTGQEVSVATAGLGGLLLTGLGIFLAWHFVFKPQLEPAHAARKALSSREKERLANLEAENVFLRDHLSTIVCTARDIGVNTKCGAK